MEDLKTIKQRYGALNEIPMGMCLINKDVRVLFGNECLEGWTKMARADMVGEEFGQGATVTLTVPVIPVEVPV